MSLCKNTNGVEVIIGYDVTMSLSEIRTPKKYNGRLLLRNPMNISDEGLMAAKYSLENSKKLSAKEHDFLHRCINEHSTQLWNAHSNLTMIGGDCVKFTRGIPINKHCVVLYCLSKGFIPLDEDPFPTMLVEQGDTIEVDVREGYFQLGPRELIGKLNEWNDPICMGSSIGREGSHLSGSVGPFVNLPNDEIGFITCSHVLFDCIYTNTFYRNFSINDPLCWTIQPSEQDFCDKDISQKRCGQIQKAVFCPETSPVSVDAALVKMIDRIPTTGHFAIKNRKQLSDAGYDEQHPPLYSGGKILNSIPFEEREKPLIKSGNTTGLTKGEFWLDGIQVRIADDDRASLGDARSSRKRIMKGQYEVRSAMTFFDNGDSGSAVFIKDPDGSLKCVGIAIGTSSFNSTIVTPISSVLKHLGITEEDMTNFGLPMNFE